MRVTISVPGRFHAFNLAHELEKRGYLFRLITSYPRFEAAKYGIPRNKVRSVIIKEIIQRGWKMFSGPLGRFYSPIPLNNALFDIIASRLIGRPDICVAWSGSALRALRTAKKQGAVTVLERGSSHILYQRDVLEDEFTRLGLPLRGLPPKKVIATELKEYDTADYIAVPSSYAKRTFMERGISEEKLIQIPYGVDTSSFRQVPKEDNIFRVIFAGGMSIQKGVHYLLRAFAELRLPHSELLLVGAINDEMKPFLKKFTSSQDVNIVCVGNKPQKELYHYYSQGSVFAHMSIQEGLALVIPQAMACGLPVVATINTGAEDIVRDGIDGYVIPIRDTDALKEKLTYLYGHQKEARAMGESAKRRVSHGFTWDDYGEKIVKEYERVIAQRTEDREQRTENRGQRTENRGQRT